MFFRDFDLTQHRTQDIASISFVRPDLRPHQMASHLAMMADGTRFHIDDINLLLIERQTGTTISAASGFFVLDLDDCEENSGIAEIRKIPVIAWNIQNNGKVTPITSTGFWEDEWWIGMTPDGAVVDASGSAYKDFETFDAMRMANSNG